MSYIFFALLIACSAQASLHKIQIKNLDLSYAYPYGTGQVEKISFGVSTKVEGFYPIEVFRREKTFEITSPFVDFEWLDPLFFIHNIQTVNLEELNLRLDYKESVITSKTLKMSMKAQKEFSFSQISLWCQGTSATLDPIKRLVEDCITAATIKASHMDLPFEVVKNISDELPNEETEDALSMPANDFALNIDQGNFNSSIRIKYILRAYLRLWGHIQYEDKGRTLALRVDSIKFGVLPVTNLVMGQLQRQVHSESVKIDPPWIRINLGE